MIVVDTNVIAALYLPVDDTGHAEALLERDPEWAVPLLWRSEFRNVLAGFLRRKLVTFEDACALQAEAESLLLGAEHEVDSHLVLTLVRESDCSAYDCEFVALARTLGVPLVTLDKKVLKAFPKHTIPLAR